MSKMTVEQAIDIIKDFPILRYEDITGAESDSVKALRMAVKALEENDKLRNQVEKMKNQVSAVEVLEFLMSDSLSVDNYWFYNYTPQKIVDKITTEYERGKE